MSTKYTQHFNTKQTVQTQPIPGRDMVQNNAGGYTFELSPIKQVERFLILGSEGGTFYVGENKLTLDNAKNLVKVLSGNTETAREALQLIVDISTSGRAYKNDPAIFALALAVSVITDPKLRSEAYTAIPQVCRTGTHLFTFMESVKGLRSWSAGLRRGVSSWYENKTDDKLAYQLVKYRQRNGWTHADVMRLAHPNMGDSQNVRWALGKEEVNTEKLSRVIQGFIEVQKQTDGKVIAKMIQEYGLPWEALPTEALNHTQVWDALLDTMKPIALTRNLGKMSALGMFNTNLNSNVPRVLAGLSKERILSEKVHPMQFLLAATTYAAGRGVKGSLTWQTNQKIVDALNKAFFDAFGNVEATGKNTMLALDCSGSMTTANVANTFIDCRTAAAAMALVTANAEPNYDLVGFAATARGQFGGMHGGGDPRLLPIKVSAKTNLDEVKRAMASIPMGGTDCSLPMRHALANKIPVETFVIYTDNETWAGPVHPAQALKEYRQKMGIGAKLVVVGMTATPFTIADPKDAGMLDVVGFDSAAPGIISEFSK